MAEEFQKIEDVFKEQKLLLQSLAKHENAAIGEETTLSKHAVLEGRRHNACAKLLGLRVRIEEATETPIKDG
jgi:hypothetical protein